eukprot:scaffold126909_cov60-Phaeocystis_antarctica.AAC.1
MRPIDVFTSRQERGSLSGDLESCSRVYAELLRLCGLRHLFYNTVHGQASRGSRVLCVQQHAD